MNLLSGFLSKQVCRENVAAPRTPLVARAARRGRTMAVAALLAALVTITLRGASTQVWEVGAYDDFLAGKFENLSLDHEGRLTLGPALETLFSSDQPLIWAVAAAPDGTIYAGTGHEGRVYKIDPSGRGQLFWSASEIEVFALAVGPDGHVYAGTSPKGKVYRLSAGGEAEVFFDPKETYIWSLAFGPAQDKQKASLFVGTGDVGKIYRVTAANQGEVYFDTQQRHVVSLAFDVQGRLLAGTDPNGVLYRVESAGKAFALFDAELSEIRSLQVTAGGAIYGAAVGSGVSQGVAGMPLMSLSQEPGAGVSINVTAGGGPGIDVNPGASTSSAGQQPVVTTPQPLITYGGAEKAAVLRVRPDYGVEKLWSSFSENLVALHVSDAPEPRVLFATDKFGRIYQLNENRDVDLVAQTDQEQVTQLVETDAGLLVATAHAGKLLRLGRSPAAAGSYETSVRDTGKVSRWGRLGWRGSLPEGTQVEFSTRSGNSARPDGSWSEWSPAIRAANGVVEGDAAIESPSARYIQWKAALRGRGESLPVLERVRVTYLPQNAPPVVHSIMVSTSASGEGDASAAPATGGIAAPGDSTASFSITVTGTGEEAASSASSTPQQTIQGNHGKRLVLTWHADDPDGDKLVATLSFRGEGESTWKLLKKDIAESVVSQFELVARASSPAAATSGRRAAQCKRTSAWTPTLRAGGPRHECKAANGSKLRHYAA
jgi:hypothetical protein